MKEASKGEGKICGRWGRKSKLILLGSTKISTVMADLLALKLRWEIRNHPSLYLIS